MVTINNQLILDEEYDENYVPTEEGIIETTFNVRAFTRFISLKYNSVRSG